MSDLWIEALSLRSSAREKILEHRFLAEIASELWARGCFDFGIARGEVDDSGFDVIIEVGAVSRHIQLKGKRIQGRAARYDVQTALADRPSGWVVVMLHHHRDLSLQGYYFFGGAAGEPLPALGKWVAKHAKGDGDGVKKERPRLRRISLGQFDFVETRGELVDRLFGHAAAGIDA